MNVNLQAALIGFAIANDLAQNRQLSDEALSAYYGSEGIRFLKRHLHRFGGFDLTEERFYAFFRQPEGNNVFTKSILRAVAFVTLFCFHAFDDVRMHIERFTDEISAEVARYLPEGKSNIALSEVTVYLLFGIRGTSLVLDNEIAVDLCDESLYESGSLNLSRLKSTIAHEVHHIAVSHKCSPMLNRAGSELERARCTILEGLVGEGMAYLYFTPHLIEQNTKQWQYNLLGIEQKIDALCALLYDSNTTAEQLEEMERKLFGEEFLGYTMGYFMIKKLHHALGLSGVVSLLNDFRLFEAYYALEPLQNPFIQRIQQ